MTSFCKLVLHLRVYFRITGALDLFNLQYTMRVENRRFGNWICFRPQLRWGDMYSLELTSINSLYEGAQREEAYVGSSLHTILAHLSLRQIPRTDFSLLSHRLISLPSNRFPRNLRSCVRELGHKKKTQWF
jgi:hypothetical protein